MNNNNITIFKKNENLNKEKLEHEEKKDEKDKENSGKKNENKKEELQIENSEKIDAQKNEVEETKIENKKNDNITIVKNNKIKVDNGNENKKNKNIINTRNQPILQLKDNFTLKENLSENKNLASKDGLTNKLEMFDQKQIQIISESPSERKTIKNEKESKSSDKEEKEDLTNYELNDLEYDEALELDNRNFLKIYLYLLFREHIILFTFFNWNDFNLFSIICSI